MARIVYNSGYTVNHRVSRKQRVVREGFHLPGKFNI